MSTVWEREAPAGGGKDYLTLKNGESARIRVFGQPIEFTESFQGGPPSVKFGTLCIYRNKAEKTNELKAYKFGWTIQKAIGALYRDADWGDPAEYDIEVTRTGEGMDTKYTVVPKPKQPLTADEKALIASCTLDMDKLFLKRASGATSDSSHNGEYDPFVDE
jgi:hypothetical protein